MSSSKMSFIGSLIKRISYSKIVPRSLLRLVDEVLLNAAMSWPGSPGRKLFNRLRGVTIGKNVWIGQGVILGQHPFLLTIQDNVIIAAGVKILTHDTSFTVVGGKDLAGTVMIGSNVHLGENAVILPGVSIGNRCVIGASAVVNKSIPSGQVATGVPAKVICSIEEGLSKLNTKLRSENFFSTW